MEKRPTRKPEGKPPQAITILFMLIPVPLLFLGISLAIQLGEENRLPLPARMMLLGGVAVLGIVLIVVAFFFGLRWL